MNTTKISLPSSLKMHGAVIFCNILKIYAGAFLLLKCSFAIETFLTLLAASVLFEILTAFLCAAILQKRRITPPLHLFTKVTAALMLFSYAALLLSTALPESAACFYLLFSICAAFLKMLQGASRQTAFRSLPIDFFAELRKLLFVSDFCIYNVIAILQNTAIFLLLLALPFYAFYTLVASKILFFLLTGMFLLPSILLLPFWQRSIRETSLYHGWMILDILGSLGIPFLYICNELTACIWCLLFGTCYAGVLVHSRHIAANAADADVPMQTVVREDFQAFSQTLSDSLSHLLLLPILYLTFQNAGANDVLACAAEVGLPLFSYYPYCGFLLAGIFISAEHRKRHPKLERYARARRRLFDVLDQDSVVEALSSVSNGDAPDSDSKDGNL